MSTEGRGKSYWRESLLIVSGLSVIWFFCPSGCAILFVDPLDKIKIAGFKPGFRTSPQDSGSASIVHSVHHGMTIAADWMSAASFISMAGLISMMGV